MADNLPALRTTTAVATVETTPETVAPQTKPDPTSWHLLAVTTGVFATAAAWTHLWPVAAGLGATCLALGAAGTHIQRGEHGE